MRFSDVLARLASLPRPLPGGPTALDPRVLVTVGPEPGWVRRARSGATRDAAALVLLFPDAAGEAYLVLTERPPGTGAHAGQVSLPGGKREPADDFPVGTALREAAEEIGLDPVAAAVRTVGVLDTVDVRVSGFVLVPVLAIATVEPELRRDPVEVAAILRVPVRHFLPEAPIEVVEDEHDGWRLRYGAFAVGEHHIWGATARVLGQLGAVLGASRP